VGAQRPVQKWMEFETVRRDDENGQAGATLDLAFPGEDPRAARPDDRVGFRRAPERGSEPIGRGRVIGGEEDKRQVGAVDARALHRPRRGVFRRPLGGGIFRQPHARADHGVNVVESCCGGQGEATCSAALDDFSRG
jgi:hypothetical protein